MRQLALGLNKNPDDLRAAFARCPDLARRTTFEQAMRFEAVQRCLAVVAELKTKARGGTRR